MDMRAQAATVLTSVGLLGLTSCAAQIVQPSQPPAPPPWAEQDRTAYNNQQVTLFVSHDSGWQAWLNAIASSEQANNALVDASRANTPVMDIIAAITRAQDAYRVATSFNLLPFTVRSSCLNLDPEVNGATRLSDGLTVRYGFLLTDKNQFSNGSSCVVSVGVIDEIDSSRGLPVATLDRDATIDWGDSFSRYLDWRQPYWKISTGTTLSVSDLVRLIEQ
jgi:hypothetical protein